MKSFVLVILFVAPAIVCGRFIIGGNKIDIAKAPHLVAVFNNGEFDCGGSLISRKFTISAAHCKRENSNMTIRIGSADKEAGGLLINVEEIIVHPEYDKKSKNYDFALLRLSDVKEFPDVVQFISLPDENDELKTGEVMQIAGWGDTQSVNESDRYLRGAFVPIFDLNECQKIYEGSITDRMVCAGFKEGGIDTCRGDSGGSLVRVSDKVLVGITSWGPKGPCAELPGVYAKVSAVRDWIREYASV